MKSSVFCMVSVVLVLVLVGSASLNGVEKNPEFQWDEDAFLPIYYMGESRVVEGVTLHGMTVEPLRFLSYITHRHVLVVDESYYIGKETMEEEFIRNEILCGVPVIAVGNTSVIKNLFDEQFCPSISGGNSPDGKPVTETAFAYMICYENGEPITKVFLTSEEDPKKAVEFAYFWIVDNIRKNDEEGYEKAVGISFPFASPYWSYQTELNYSSGDSWSPYGRLNVRTKYYKLYEDGSSSYDWYDIRCKHQVVPGESLGWGGNWRNAWMKTWIDANYYMSSYILTDYGPTTTSGTSTVGVNVGVTAGSEGASVSSSMSWSYSISDVPVYDNSDFYTEKAEWTHDVNESKAVGGNTYLAEPGACIRVPQGGAREWREHYGAKWGQLILFLFWNYTTEGSVEFHI